MTEQPYWMIDTSLFSGRFRYFGEEAVLVRGKAHRSQEHYGKEVAKQEFIPIHAPGERTYIHLKPFVLVSDIMLTVGLYPSPRGEAIGEVVRAAEEPKKREIEIGQAQAWYYAQERALLIWECFLQSFTRDHPLLQDQNMRRLWQSFEVFLIAQFPEVVQIATPFREPIFVDQEYQAFLQTLGYGRIAQATYGKRRASATAGQRSQGRPTIISACDGLE